jgi:hypothetical protein
MIAESFERDAPQAAARRLRDSVLQFAPVFLTAIAAVWIVMSFTYPFGWDQGILSWAGHIVARGGLPYRDAWDMKGPAAFYAFAATERLFGVNLWGVRFVDALLLIGAALCVSAAVSRLVTPRMGKWSAIVFVLWYASHSYWNTAQPDGWAAMLLAIAVLPTLVNRTALRPRRIVLIGIGIGITILIKPLYGAFVLLPVCLVVGAPLRRSSRVGLAASLAGGLLVPIAICAGWFAAHRAFGELWSVYVRYPATVYDALGGITFLDAGRGIVEYFLRAPVVAVGLPIVIVGVLTLWDTNQLEASVLVGWLMVATLLVVAQGRFFAYHWLPILPPAVVLGSIGFESIARRHITLAAIVGVLILANVIAPIALEEARFAAWLSGGATARYYDGYGQPGDDMRAVKWLEREGGTGKVFVFGWNAAIPWLGHRETVSRFGFSMPLLIEDDRGFRDRYRDELLAAIRRDPPQFIIVGSDAPRILRRTMTVADFPALAGVLHESYKPVVSFGAIEIHERLVVSAAGS